MILAFDTILFKTKGRLNPTYSEDSYGMYAANPQRFLFLNLNNCYTYNFYSSSGTSEDWVGNNSICINQVIDRYYSGGNILRNDFGASGSLIYKRSEYTKKRLYSGQERFFFNETESITAMLTGVQHKNNKDYWVIYHKNLTNYFSVHLVKTD